MARDWYSVLASILAADQAGAERRARSLSQLRCFTCLRILPLLMRWVLNVVVLLLAIALAALLAEGALRLYVEMRAGQFVGAPVAYEFFVHEPLLEYWNKPGYRSADGRITHDDRGFRLNGQEPRDPDKPLVALLGGSTAYGWFWQADRETIPALLERELPTVSTLNAGVTGFTTLQALLVYHDKVAALRPPVVVVLAGFNDLFYARYPRWTGKMHEIALRARRDPALRPAVEAINGIALRSCLTCHYLGSHFQTLYERLRLEAALHPAQLLGQQDPNQPNFRAMELTAWSLAELARRVEADGGCLIVAWQPMMAMGSKPLTVEEQESAERIGVQGAYWRISRAMFTALVERTASALAPSQATILNLTGVFDSTEERVYEDDGVHYTVLGNRVIAQALAPTVAGSPCLGAQPS